MKSKKIYYSLAVFLILFFCALSLRSQEKIMFRPLKYDSPHRTIDTRPVGDQERDQVMPWFVVSIHENAETTTSPGGSQKKKSLKFGELFYVTGEERNYLRIAKDDRRQDFNLSRHAEDYGWVHKDHVLMWQRALENQESKISLKGLILNTTRTLLDGRQINYQRIEAYRDPGLKIAAGFEAKLFEIFYVFRYSNDRKSVLLGRSPFFSERQYGMDQIAGGLIGWVDIDRVLEWDHRVALEPNFNPDAVNERARRGIKSTIFTAAEGGGPDDCARSFSAGTVPADCLVAWDDDIYDSDGDFERKPGYWRRFPVIGDPGTDIYKVSVMGELRGELGQTIRQEVDAEVRQRLNQLIGNVRNINVVFAIDGTNSMQPYYQSVINSVQRIVDDFERTGADYKNLKFGYVVYRDYLERDRLLETRQLTNNSQAIINALRNVDARDFHDIHVHESVYYGLRAAISQVLVDPNETNILIHIGDAGSHYRNDPSQVPQQVIVDLISEFKVHYIAYQVHHRTDHVAYDDFPRQVKEIMTKSSQALFREWQQLLGSAVVSEQPVLRQINPNISRIENGHPMLLIQSDRGRELDLTYLENEITRAIEEIDKYTDNVVERAREMLERGRGIEVIAGETGGTYASSFSGGMYNFLVRLGIDEDVLKDYYSSNVQLVLDGYASRNHASLNRPIFTPVLLLTVGEFHRIINSIDRLRAVTQATGDRRELLYNVWVELLKRHVGIQPQGFYDRLSLEEAAQMVFGVPLRSSMLQQIQLKDIHDHAVFPNTELARYMNQIDFKHRQLNAIANSRDYQFSFISNDILYYWIDVDLLP